MESEFVRDPATNALLNRDVAGFKRFKAERERMVNIQQMAAQMETMQQEFSEIKALLQQLVREK